MHTVRLVWGRRPLALMALATLLSSAEFTVPVSTLYLLHRGLSLTEVFTLETVLVVTIMLCDLPTGLLADRTDDRRVLLAGYALCALGAVGWVLAGGFLQFAAISVVEGIGLALVSGADASYLARMLGDQEDRLTAVFGHLGALGGVAGALAGVLGGALARWDLVWPAVATAVTACLAALALVGLPAADRPASGPGEEEKRPAVRDLLRVVATTPVLALSALQPWILVGAAYYLNQLRWAATGVPVAWFGALLALATLLGAGAAHAADRVARALGGERRLVALATLGTAVGFGAMAMPHPVATTSGFVTVVAAAALRTPVAQSLTARAAPGAVRAGTLSLVSTVSGLLGAAANPAVGVLAELSVPLACGVLAGVLGLFALAWAKVAARGAREPAGSA